ncbi:hypothetical protein K1T71_009670 [Dendrolimus kikuchii]|uniref:Uncharacterized protein n=1 Tax=Dendrolimus kikuchii TaxID=765133 RepID=A0ACC1CTE6_9NEOP|nr:hypothetical protein K1T71_009670 [Dendrolimus kikuchii]
MAQSLVVCPQDLISNENSLSTKEFLDFEKTCEAYKDSDEEIKLIFNEIKRLSSGNNKDNVLGDDVEDVDLILKRAEDIAQETVNLLKSSPVASTAKIQDPSNDDQNTANGIPQITVTKPFENNIGSFENKSSPNHKVEAYVM